MTDVLVIGAGVIGASVAFRLAQRGVRAVVLEASRPCGGASGATFAWLNAARKRPRAYFEMNVAGMRAYDELAAELGGASWLHRGGRLEWFADEQRSAADKAFERLRAWGYAGGWITPSEAAGLEPGIDSSELPPNVAFFPEEGWIDPTAFVGRMLAEAVRCGVQLVQGRGVGVEFAGGRAVGVRLADGSRLEADLVINCAGAAVNEAAGQAVLRTPMASTLGLLAFTQPAAATVSRIVATPALSFRPDGGGRLMMHSGAADSMAAVRPEEAGRLATDLVRRLRRVAPGLGNIDCEAVTLVERPVPADGYPVIGRVDGIAGYYVAVAHSGVTLAPLLGRLVAQEVTGGRAVESLEPYRPSRFMTAVADRPATAAGACDRHGRAADGNIHSRRGVRRGA